MVPNSFRREDSWNCKNTDGINVAIRVQPAFALINDRPVRSTGKSKMTKGNAAETGMRAESVLPNDRKLALALALIDAAQG